ncbi:hypothetical protein J2785_005372 [Burkholderia ambifaria]|nr:hypothetical protein [Burkholderia ambifaria]
MPRFSFVRESVLEEVEETPFVAGAQASANLYSLVETCKANDVEPYRYLVWLFTRLPLAATADDYADLMPWRMPAALTSEGRR